MTGLVIRDKTRHLRIDPAAGVVRLDGSFIRQGRLWRDARTSWGDRRGPAGMRQELRKREEERQI